MLQTLHRWNGPTSIWQICWAPSSVRNNDVDKPVARHFNAANHSISDIKVCAISPISSGSDSRKRHEKRLIFKIVTIHPHGLNERFSFIWSYRSLHSFCFCLARADKSVDFSPFTPLFMFIHLPLIHFAPPPRLLIDFKNSKWLLHPIMHLLLFLSPDWLTFCHVIISYTGCLKKTATLRNSPLF